MVRGTNVTKRVKSLVGITLIQLFLLSAAQSLSVEAKYRYGPEWSGPVFSATFTQNLGSPILGLDPFLLMRARVGIGDPITYEGQAALLLDGSFATTFVAAGIRTGAEWFVEVGAIMGPWCLWNCEETHGD